MSLPETSIHEAPRAETPLVCIVGPTGAGKTAAALALAQTFADERASSCVRHTSGTPGATGAWVINADSRQVYRHFPVITAQPTPAEQAVCPHRLYGMLGIDEACSAGRWEAAARECIAEAKAAEVLPLLVGGTGLYLRALTDGMVEIPPVPEAVRERLEREYAEAGGEALYARLCAADPDYAARVHPRNRQRLIRALAVMEGTGKTFSWWHAQTPPAPFPRTVRVGVSLPLEELTPRLAARVQAMLAAGAINEARAAMNVCADPHAPGWSGIGCAELFAHLSGELSFDQSMELWIKNTRAYAKRQLTWFRADARIRWFRPEEIEALVTHVQEQIVQLS